jgi:hypothetical protein
MFINFERVDALLSYDPETGILRWKVSRQGRGCRAGAEVGSSDKDGYLNVMLDGKVYKAHRLAHLLMTGHWPERNPEHENRIKSDNRWENIKDLARNQSENMGNQGPHMNNTSGLKGVSWDKQKRKWMSRIRVRRPIPLGYFTDLRLAGLTYDAAAKLAWGLRFSCLNFPPEESDHIVLLERVFQQIESAHG